ncbi:hypothetical protein, partial [Rahnella sp. AN3-3W3]|uniref:hypothetical protein n=1 Tax=Rahnella sp. AN3-3W3 TaxID=1610578 RepID=UPI001E438273
ATGWKSCRCAVPSFRDCSLWSATSHSASFLNRPQDLKFKTKIKLPLIEKVSQVPNSPCLLEHSQQAERLLKKRNYHSP